MMIDVTGVLVLQALTCASNLPITHKCAIHALVAAYLNLMSQLTAIPALCQHVVQVTPPSACPPSLCGCIPFFGCNP